MTASSWQPLPAPDPDRPWPRDRWGSLLPAVSLRGMRACAEIRWLSTDVAEVRLVVADAKVQEVVDLDGLEAWLTRRRARGGGGTDHRPVFEWIRQSGLHPDVFVGITDLFTTLPAARPSWPVLWVTPRRHGRAPGGRVIEVG